MADETGESMYDNVTPASSALQVPNTQWGASSSQPIFDSCYQTLASSLPNLPPIYQRLQGQQPTSHQPVGGPAAYYPPNANGQSPQQQMTVITSGQLPAAAAERRDEPCCLMYTPHVALSCFVFWLCGLVIGLVAYILAIVAQSKSSKDATLARRLGHASIAVSVVGIVVGCVILAAVLGTQLSTKCPQTQFHIDGKCFQYRTSDYDSDGCDLAFQGTTYYDPQQGYCYYNCSNYLVFGTCYNFRVVAGYRSCSGSTYNGAHSDGSYCYFNCTSFYAGGLCFTARTSAYAYSSSISCRNAFVSTTYYDGAYCYYNYSSSACNFYEYFAGGSCFSSRSTGYETSYSCDSQFSGTTFYDGIYCYYGYSSAACSRYNYFVGGACFNSQRTGSGLCSGWSTGGYCYS